MSLANATDLKNAVADWLYRTGDTALAARADDFIALFEADFLIDPENRALEMEGVSTTTLSSATVPLPDDFIEMIRLQVTNAPAGTPNQVLDFRTPAQAAKLDATTAQTGVAKWYTVLAGNIVILPQRWVPTGATLELAYYSFEPLSAAVGNTNWLLQKYPNLYLYGALMQASAYVDNADAVAKWKAGRDEAMAKFTKTEQKRKGGAGPLAMSPSAGFVK